MKQSPADKIRLNRSQTEHPESSMIDLTSINENYAAKERSLHSIVEFSMIRHIEMSLRFHGNCSLIRFHFNLKTKTLRIEQNCLSAHNFTVAIKIFIKFQVYANKSDKIAIQLSVKVRENCMN